MRMLTIQGECFDAYEKIVVEENGKFRWYINLMGKKFEVKMGVEGRKNNAKFFFEENNVHLSQISSGCNR